MPGVDCYHIMHVCPLLLILCQENKYIGFPPRSKIYVTMKQEAPHAFNMGVVNGEPFVGEMFTSVSFHW